MQVFRQYRYRLVWFALIAIAGQIVLTFGHVHAHGHDFADAEARHDLHGVLAARAAMHAQHGAAPEDREPPEVPKHSDDFDQLCAFCRTMVQAQSLVLPSLPAVRFTDLPPSFTPLDRADGIPAAEHPAPYGPRAPPPMA